MHDKLRIGTKDAKLYLLKPQSPARTLCVWSYNPTVVLYFIGNARLQRKARQLDLFEEFEDFDIPGIYWQYSLIVLVTKSTGVIHSFRFNVELCFFMKSRKIYGGKSLRFSCLACKPSPHCSSQIGFLGSYWFISKSGADLGVGRGGRGPAPFCWINFFFNF